MVKHVILWKLKDEHNNVSVKQGIKNGLEGLLGKVPGLIEIKVEICGLASSNADVMLYSVFENEEINENNIENTDFYKELKQYRYEKSKEESLKPYMVYKNEQIEEIIKKMPKNIGELKSIRGFGYIKCEKYGRDIIKIVEKYN